MTLKGTADGGSLEHDTADVLKWNRISVDDCVGDFSVVVVHVVQHNKLTAPIVPTQTPEMLTVFDGTPW